MDKKTFTGLFLMLIVIVGSVFLMRPSEEEIRKEQLLQDSIAQARNIQIDSSIQSNPTDTNTLNASITPQLDSIALSGPFGASKGATEETYLIENELIKVNISNKG